MKDIKEVYPPYPYSEGYLSEYDYNPLIESLGYEILVKVDKDDYQGDSLVLLKDNEKNLYGYLTFGWGSCDGCDALQACRSYEELGTLRMELNNSIIWFPYNEAQKFFREHDWEGDFIEDNLVNQFQINCEEYFGNH